jgi:metallophosphoesterase (TIGR00282 family)
MRILFIADVVGKPGRRAIRALLPAFADVDLVIANAENAAGGLGITPKIARKILGSGVHVITSGNHHFRKAEIAPFMDEEPRILRPHNFRTRAPGRGFGIFETASGEAVGVLNLSGQLYMDPADDPAIAADAILEGPLADVPVRILDFHAEATGEKRGMLFHLDGRVSALLGTHTHVQTADEQVTDQGTAYITDAGMTGATRSVIGMDPTPVLEGIRTGLPQRYLPAKGDAELQGVVVDIDPSGRATAIRRVREAYHEEPDA